MAFLLGGIVRAMLSFALAISDVRMFSICLLHFILINNKEQWGLGAIVIPQEIF